MIPKSRPYIANNGTIVIPFIIDQRYTFWNGGQPLSTLQEIDAPEEVWRQYIKNHTLGNRLELGTWLREGMTNTILRSQHRDDRSF